MNVGSCADACKDIHEFASILLPYFDILADRSNTNAVGGGAQINEKLNYEEVFGDNLKTLDEVLDEMKDLLTIILESDRTIIWLLDPESGKLKFHNPPAQHVTQPLEQEIEHGTSIPAYVTNHKQHIMMCGEINTDCRFPLGNEDNRTRSIVCVPILRPNEEIAGAIECYRLTEIEYDANDLHTLMTLMIWIGAIIDQQLKRDHLQAVQDRNNTYMGFLQEFFTKDTELDKLLFKIFDCTKSLVHAERGYIALVKNVDNPMEVDIYDEIPGKQIMKMKSYTLDPERGCASMCLRTRKIINIVNPEKKLYDLELDRYIGTTTTSILCLPILDGQHILGCIQLFNKFDGNFDELDELEIGHVLVYYSLLLHGMRVDKRIKHNDNLNNVMHEMLSFELNKIIQPTHIDENIDIPENFDSYSFTPKDPALLPSYCYYIFNAIIDPQFFDAKKYMHFILLVHRNYRSNPFHNFENMYMSLHGVYIILKANINNIEPCEVIAILITTLCLAIDHRGLTNTYFTTTKHPLQFLYSGHSHWQNHCLWLTREIISKVGLFSQLAEDCAKQIDDILEKGFLALDYSFGLKTLSKLHPIIRNKAFHWNTPSHRTLIHILILYAGNVTLYTKDYAVARHGVECLLKEHFIEGQLFKERGIATALIADRSRKHEILEKEVTFMKTITIPVFELCTYLLDHCDELLEGANNLLKVVEDIISTRGQKVWYPDENFGKFGI